MTATFLVFLLCGQPVYVFLNTQDNVTLYAIGEMPDARKHDFMETMDEVIKSGQAKRLNFKVEDQVKGMTCGTST